MKCRNSLFTGGVWVMYADVARIKVRKASNCSLGDRLCSFAFPMFVGPIQQTIITPRRVLGGGRAVSAVRLGTAMDQTFLHDFVNKSELTKELSSVRTSGGGGHGAGTHGDGAASGRGDEGSQDASGQLGGDASSLGRVGPAASSNDASSTGVNTSSGLTHVDATDECVDDGSPAYAAALERDRLAQTNALASNPNSGGDVTRGARPQDGKAAAHTGDREAWAGGDHRPT
jgi:hypothetical protein